MTRHTDTQRLDWLSRQSGEGLFSDDAGRWVVSTGGMQDVPDPDHAIDIMTSHFIEAKRWRKGIRRAIDAAMAEQEKEAKQEKEMRAKP